MSDNCPPCDPFAPGNLAVMAAVGAMVVAGSARKGSLQEELETVYVGGRDFHGPPMLIERVQDALAVYTDQGDYPPMSNPRVLSRWIDGRAKAAKSALSRPRATAFEKRQATEELQNLSGLRYVFDALRLMSGDSTIRMRVEPVRDGDMLLVDHAAAAKLAKDLVTGSQWEVIHVGVNGVVTLLPLDAISRRQNRKGYTEVPMKVLRTVLSHRQPDGSPVARVESFR
jgi:hypothetical protein